MKEVIYPTVPANYITFANLESITQPLLGFVLRNDKVTLVPSWYNANTYFARTRSSWEKGNGFDPHDSDKKTVKEWCDFFVNAHKAKIFLFDSPKELFKWLAE